MIDLIIYICSIVLLRIYIHNLKQGPLSLIHIEDLDESNDAIRSPRVYDTGSRKQEVQYIVLATVLCPLELLFLERRRRGRSFFFHVSSTVFVRWFLSRFPAFSVPAAVILPYLFENLFAQSYHFSLTL